MKRILLIPVILQLFSCAQLHKVDCIGNIPQRQVYAISGSEFAAKAEKLNAEQREEFILQEICAGNFPVFMRKLVEIQTVAMIDGKNVTVKYFVMPDYLMIGNDEDFVRVPMQSQTAQQIADMFGFFLSSPKICDDVYKAAEIKLEPVPLTVARDSFHTFIEHHKIIENQRKNRKGLIAGIKKDVVITGALLQNTKNNRVAIYGWHKLDGKPIQPVYTGHIDRYVDYSHGIRLVCQTVTVNGKQMNYMDILTDKKLSVLLCNDENCSYFKYPY